MPFTDAIGETTVNSLDELRSSIQSNNETGFNLSSKIHVSGQNNHQSSYDNDGLL